VQRRHCRYKRPSEKEATRHSMHQKTRRKPSLSALFPAGF
jgi:hypothetical protein